MSEEKLQETIRRMQVEHLEELHEICRALSEFGHLASTETPPGPVACIQMMGRMKREAQARALELENALRCYLIAASAVCDDMIPDVVGGENEGRARLLRSLHSCEAPARDALKKGE